MAGAEADQDNLIEQQNVARSIREVQQSFGESLGFADEVIWDLLSNEQANILKNKILELIRDPEVPEGLAEREREEAERNVKKQCAINERMRETLFTQIWQQRKYTNRQSLTAILYVLVATDETDHNVAGDSRTWSCHPVFRARRCRQRRANGTNRDGNSSNNSECCMLFVDENGRVYQNWSSYVSENELPAGIMVAPRRGIYQLDTRGDVQLETWITPAASPQRKMLGILDTTTAIGGFAAACIPIAAFLTLPVSAPIMAGAAFVGLASAGYATARSGTQLVDRSQHEQSINVTDRTARSQWLGVLAGTAGLGAAGATSAMTAATAAGREVGAITQLTVNSLNISAITISAGGVCHGAVDLFLKYQDGDNIATMDVLQLAASLAVFTHSACNFKLASTIISETSNNTIGSYRESLSNRQRRMFDKLTKETIRTKGAVRGKVDVIRNVNEIPSRQEFNDLYKINRQLNEQGVRPTFASDGAGVVLNDQVRTSGAELRASIQHNVGADVLGQVTQPIPESFSGGTVQGNNARHFTMPSRLIAPTVCDAAESNNNGNRNYSVGVAALRLSSVVVNGGAIALSNYGPFLFEHIINAESFETALLSLADNLDGDILNFVLNLTDTFMSTLLEELNEVLQFYITSESVLYRIGLEVLTTYRDHSLNRISQYTLDILNAVKAYFLSLNPDDFPELLTKCKICPGSYSICNL